MRAADILDTFTAYDFTTRLSPDGRAWLSAHATPLRAGPGVVRCQGDPCDSVSLLEGGEVLVRRRRPSGREIVLYTVSRGEICVLEALAVLTGAPFRGEAEAVGPARGLLVEGEAFRLLVAREAALRAFVFQAIEGRLARTLDLACEVALDSLESRLATLVLRHAGGSADVRTTHEHLAQELGCGREAVSRLLEAWARRGLLRLGRAHVEVVQRDVLRALAGRAGESSGAA